MGNQLPVKCVAVCNPSCCANCINPQTGRDDGDATAVSAEGRNGNIFANASAVLSEDDRQDPTADFDLEKELANEVELWRLQASTSSLLASEAHRRKMLEQSSPRGRTEERATGLASARRQARGTMPFERSVSPPSRTQVSLHNRVGLTPRDQVDPLKSTPRDPQKADPQESIEQPPASRVAIKERTASSTGPVESTRESTANAEESTHPAVPSEKPSCSEGQEKATTATAATSEDVPPESQYALRQDRPLVTDTLDATSEVSSEDSTFVGFIEETLEREGYVPGGEYRVLLHGGPKSNGARFNAREGSPGDADLPDCQSFANSEASLVKPDRTVHF